jgi:hypothetical protein
MTAVGLGTSAAVLLTAAVVAGPHGGRPHRTRIVTPISAGAPSRSCRSPDLAGQFRGGGYATGNDFGEILIRDVAASPCMIGGALGFTALDMAGRPIGRATLNLPSTIPPTVLTANTRSARDGNAPTIRAYLIVPLIGAERDDPTTANGLCNLNDEIRPTTLIVEIGSVCVPVANYDPNSPQVTAVYGCHGTVLAEGASIS